MSIFSSNFSQAELDWFTGKQLPRYEEPALGLAALQKKFVTRTPVIDTAISSMGTIANIFLGGGGRRIFTGAFGGMIAGETLTEDNTSTSIAKNRMLGAFTGATLGALTTKTAGRAYKFLGKKLLPGKAFLKSGLAGIFNIAKEAPRAMSFLTGVGMKHPYLMAGLAAIALLGTGLSFATNPENKKTMLQTKTGMLGYGVYDAYSAYNSEPTQSRSRFMNSAAGLVQGLHNNRHG